MVPRERRSPVRGGQLRDRHNAELKTPLRFEKGSVLRCIAHYDNTAANPNNPDPTREVRWGGQTSEEMMIGFLDVSLDVPIGSKELHRYDLSYVDWVTPKKRNAVYH
ncbi:MAG: hypothetical protein ACLQVI_31740 [Polyangiaceae bacterium]